MSDVSKDAIIELLRERIKELESENKRFKEDNQRLQGKLYEMI
jgi:predicted nuclease with TOPRIM domain